MTELVWLLSLPTASAQFLPPIDLPREASDLIFETDKSIDPLIESTTSNLGDSGSQSSKEITDEVEDLADKAANKVERPAKSL